MEKIKFGIIGVGNQGTYYASLFNKGEIINGELVAICDLQTAKMETVINNQETGNIASFTNYIEMLDSKLCDAVLIVTPHYQHPEMVIECLKRGVHVICDKPAGVYTKQVREMNEVAKKSNAKFSMMFNQRTNCFYRKMKEIIANGGIGELQRVNWIITYWFRTQAYYDSGAWRATWSGEGGGVMINQCPHQIDLAQWVVGQMPKTVRGFCKYGQWHDIEVEDEVTAYFEYENGATGVLIMSTGEAPGTNRFEISGTKGKLLCEDGKLYWWKNEEDSQEFSNSTKEKFGKIPYEKVEVETDGIITQHAGIINNFANALLGLEDLFVDGIDGIKMVELMNAMELSGWNDGEKIALPVDEERYLKELQEYCTVSRRKVADDSQVSDTKGSF